MTENHRKTLEIDTDGLLGSTRFRVYETFEKRFCDEYGEFWKLESELIEDLTMKWSEIKQEYGCQAALVRELKELYSVK